ncbi:MAG: Zinc protease [Labilithrix sp.]|nr:Zinc protease [Labilithrix sp.]
MNALRGLLLTLTVLAALCGCSPARAPADTYKLDVHLATTEFDLPNGLHVVLHRDLAAQVALVHVRYEVGSKDDPVGRAGFAHLFEHLMFRGSKNTGGRDYAQWLEESGSVFNASTEVDHTDYHAYVVPEALPRALWLEADRMAYPFARLDQAGFERERRVVENEARERYDNEPLGNLRAIARQAVFGEDHPYGLAVIGRARELEAITLAEARTFAATYYRPNNATLVVAGAFDPAQVRELVTRYFATIPAGAARPVRALPPVRLAAGQRLAVEADVEGPAVMVAFPAPAEHEAGADELAFGLEYAAGYVEQSLVLEVQSATSVQALYERDRLGGLVTILVRLKPGASTGRALEIVEGGISRASSVGRQATWDELPSIKTLSLVKEVHALEHLDGRAERILHGLEYHRRADATREDFRRMQGVDAADIGSAVEQFLGAPHVTIVVTPKAGAPRAGRRVAP